MVGLDLVETKSVRHFTILVAKEPNALNVPIGNKHLNRPLVLSALVDNRFETMSGNLGRFLLEKRGKLVENGDGFALAFLQAPNKQKIYLYVFEKNSKLKTVPSSEIR